MVLVFADARLDKNLEPRVLAFIKVLVGAS
jgi:hypothetical protein